MLSLITFCLNFCCCYCRCCCCGFQNFWSCCFCFPNYCCFCSVDCNFPKNCCCFCLAGCSFLMNCCCFCWAGCRFRKNCCFFLLADCKILMNCCCFSVQAGCKFPNYSGCFLPVHCNYRSCCFGCGLLPYSGCLQVRNFFQYSKECMYLCRGFLGYELLRRCLCFCLFCFPAYGLFFPNGPRQLPNSSKALRCCCRGYAILRCCVCHVRR